MEIPDSILDNQQMSYTALMLYVKLVRLGAREKEVTIPFEKFGYAYRPYINYPRNILVNNGILKFTRIKGHSGKYYLTK